MLNIQKSQKFLIFSSFMMSFLMGLSSNSMFSLWMSMEINLFSFIPLMSMKESKNIEKSLTMYFLFQSISSTLMIFSAIFLLNFQQNIFYSENYYQDFYFYVMFFMSISMKTGMFPFHFWVLTVVEGMSWDMCFFIFSVQKMIPLISLMLINQEKFILFMIVLNSMLASIMGLTSLSLRKIMTFSSMNHISMMMFCILNSKYLFIKYLYMYMYMLWILTFIFLKKNMNYIFQTFFSKENTINLNIFFGVLSLMGLPPLMGFFPKLFIIKNFMEMEMFFIMLVFILSSCLSIFFYLRIMISYFLMNLNLNFLMMKKKKEKKFIQLPHWMIIFIPWMTFN